MGIEIPLTLELHEFVEQFGDYMSTGMSTGKSYIIIDRVDNSPFHLSVQTQAARKDEYNMLVTLKIRSALNEFIGDLDKVKKSFDQLKGNVPAPGEQSSDQKVIDIKAKAKSVADAYNMTWVRANVYRACTVSFIIVAVGQNNHEEAIERASLFNGVVRKLIQSIEEQIGREINGGGLGRSEVIKLIGCSLRSEAKKHFTSTVQYIVPPEKLGDTSEVHSESAKKLTDSSVLPFAPKNGDDTIH